MVKQGILLDSNVLSELRKGSKSHPNVQQWSRSQSPATLYTSVICMMEIRSGILSALRKNPEFGILLQDWYETKLKPAFQSRVLPVNLASAETAAGFHHQRTLPFRDALIAATAKSNGISIATRNLRDFEGFGVNVINPWE